MAYKSGVIEIVKQVTTPIVVPCGFQPTGVMLYSAMQMGQMDSKGFLTSSGQMNIGQSVNVVDGEGHTNYFVDQGFCLILSDSLGGNISCIGSIQETGFTLTPESNSLNENAFVMYSAS